MNCELDIHGSVHQVIFHENDQQDAIVQDNLLFLGCSTYCERYFRSSSGASKLYLRLELTSQSQLSHETSRQRLTRIIPEAVNTV